MNKQFIGPVLLVAIVLLLTGCSVTHRVAYPPADELFVTMGDDPGSESEMSYIPKGLMVHSSSEWYIPLPLLGLITFGESDPQYVFEDRIYPKVLEMGGDSLTNARVDHYPPPKFLWRFLGIPLIFLPPSSTVVTGQVVKRPASE